MFEKLYQSKDIRYFVVLFRDLDSLLEFAGKYYPKERVIYGPLQCSVDLDPYNNVCISLRVYRQCELAKHIAQEFPSRVYGYMFLPELIPQITDRQYIVKF